MRLANASMTPEQLRNRDKNYNKISLAEAQKIVPDFSLEDYLKERGITARTEIDFQQPTFFAEFDKMLTDVPLDQWKTYLRWMVAELRRLILCRKPFVDETFNFQGRFLSGIKEQQQRWKRCTEATDRTLGEAVGAEWVKAKFTPEQEKAANDMIDHLFAAMKNAHPEPAVDERCDKAKGTCQTRRLQTKDRLQPTSARIRRPEDRPLHRTPRMTPCKRISDRAQRTGHRQADRQNAMGIYAADGQCVVQSARTTTSRSRPAFFSRRSLTFRRTTRSTMAESGAVIGHEISHGFDDQGSKYDAEGNQVNWWTPEDRTKFEERANCVIDQFNGYRGRCPA